MRFFDFPVVRFSIFLALGVVFSSFFPSHWWFIALACCIPLLVLTWLLARKNIFQKPFFGIITYLSFFCLGASNYQLRSPDYHKRHYVHFISEEENPCLVLEIISTQKPNSFSHRFIAEVKSVNSSPTHGKLLVYLRKDSTKVFPHPGEHIMVFAQPKELDKPLNPGQFDYAKYLISKDIYRQLRIDSEEIIRTDINNTGLISRIHALRSSLLEKLDAYPFGDEELSILKALSLGHRNSIDESLYKSYASAGAIHVLAVSGLHVGIIYFILQWLFRPILFLPRGRKINVVLVVISLIFYALLTGMSPSVTRAVTMFSFFGMARLINRPTNSINTLFLSFFFLLLWNPKWLLDVGFQLSYMAVFFIIWLHPKVYGIYRPKYIIDKLVWSTITVSFCAQLGVAPLSIYYFNQFPGLFLLSNVVILPFIGLLVGSGLLLVLLTSMDLAPIWFVQTVNTLVRLLNRFVIWISEQEQFILRDLVLSEKAVLASYITIFCLMAVFINFNYRRFRSLLITVVILIVVISPIQLDRSTNRLIVFHKNKKTLVGIEKNNNLLILKQDSTNISNEFPIASFRTDVRSQYYSEEIISSVIQFKEIKILVVDSSGIYPEAHPVDMVLLSGSPKVHLDILIHNLRPKTIIADGSNYRSYVKRWSETCKNRKLPFHHTGTSGAFILE